MEDPRYVEGDVFFRRGGHRVRLRLAPAALGVEVEAHGTAEQWRADFDAASIEDLTHKTGNFKQFGIFCSMLESALTQSSDSVSLELLTYADLETLRSRKFGGGPARTPPPAAASPLGSKRYLILLYSVEFDRIHYPLPLPYVGRPDAAVLARALREARRGEARRDAEIRHLRDGLRRAAEEKRAAEDELRRERSRHRRAAAELAEAKASQRRLELRVKSLTAELAACKKGPRPPSRPQERRSASRESCGRPPTRSPSPAGPPRFDPTAFVRARQRRQREAELKNRPAFGSTSPARSRGRSSSAESFRSRRSAASSGSDAEKRSEPSRGRKPTRTRRPLSASSSNGARTAPRAAAGHKPPTGTGNKRPGKENCYEEPSAELAEIDARLQALQEYMDRLDTWA